MALQPSQTKSRFVQLATSGLLVIQATIATTSISTLIIQPGRVVAQEQLTPRSTSANNLGKPLQVNCQPTTFDEEKPSFCGGAGYGPDVPNRPNHTPTPTTESPVVPIRVKLLPNCTHPSGSPALICVSVP